MATLVTTLLHGLAICIPFTAFVVITFSFMPRLWLHSLPPDIAQRVPPKSRREVLLTRWLMLPVFMAILPGLSVVSTVFLIQTNSITSFAGILAHLYAIWTIVHLWDLLVIDLGAMSFINPARPPIAGTENARGWRDMYFHVRSLLIAVPMSGLFVVPAAIILWALILK